MEELDGEGISIVGSEVKFIKQDVFTLIENEPLAKTLLYLNTGKGGTFKGGWNLVSEEGGHDPTKFKSLNPGTSINIDLLLLTVSNGGNLGKGSLPELPDIKDPLGAAEFIDKLKDLQEENTPEDKSVTNKRTSGSSVPSGSNDPGTYPGSFDVTDKKNGNSMGQIIWKEEDSINLAKDNKVTRVPKNK